MSLQSPAKSLETHFCYCALILSALHVAFSQPYSLQFVLETALKLTCNRSGCGLVLGEGHIRIFTMLRKKNPCLFVSHTFVTSSIYDVFDPQNAGAPDSVQTLSDV